MLLGVHVNHIFKQPLIFKLAYDVRVQGNSTKVELTYFGHIVNNTTEDWKEARLSLSTASPDISGAPPTLTTKSIYARASKYNKYDFLLIL